MEILNKTVITQEILEECARQFNSGEAHRFELVGAGRMSLLFQVIFKIPQHWDVPLYFKWLYEGDGEGGDDIEPEDLDLVHVYPKEVKTIVWEDFKR